MSINRCDTCHELEFHSCTDSIIIAAGLQHSHNYYIWLKDKFDHYYEYAATSASNGDITIDLTNAAFAGLKFDANSGVWEFSISTSDTENTSESLTINGSEYPCVNISFFDLN